MLRALFRPPRSARRPSVRRFRPRLEWLEDRCVPAGAVLFQPGFLANTIAPTSFGSTGPVAIGFQVDFFGNDYSQLYINSNGTVSFGQGYTEGPPAANLSSVHVPLIAPFLAQIDTRGPADSEAIEGTTNSTAAGTSQGGGTVTYGKDVVNGHAAFGVIWDAVGYYNRHNDKTNTFQLILIDRSDIAPGDFDIEFNYDQVQWESGDGSGGKDGLGGHSAQVGYASGTGTYFALAGSGVPGSFLDGNPTTGLVNGQQNGSGPGQYAFFARQGTVAADFPPQLAALGPFTVDEGATLTFTASATDQSVPVSQLTYSLVGAPAGATIDPHTGQFSWTPSAAQVPGQYNFSVKVSDNLSPAMTDQQPVSVSVVDLPPKLAAIGPLSVNEGDTLTFTASATDAGTAIGETLTYSLVGAPQGATIDAQSGKFSWQPTASQVPGQYTFTVQVNDSSTPSLSDRQQVSATVVDLPPTLAALGPFTVDEGQTLTFTASATDAGTAIGETLTYSLIAAPQGATIDPHTGKFRWQPTASQVPGQYMFTVQVNDSSTPSLTDQQPVSVTVVDLPPQLAALGPFTVDEGQTLTFTASATDPGTAIGESLSYSLVGAPQGATIDPGTGKFSWQPTASQIPGVYTFGVQVNDSSTPSLSDEQQVSVTVVDLPPKLAPLGPFSFNEGNTVTFTASASDAGLAVGETLTYSLTAAPTGAAIDPTSGKFTWTPDATEPPGQYSFTVKVTDSSTPALSDQEQVNVTIVDVAPVVQITPPATPFVGVGSDYVAQGSFTDPGFGPWTVTIDYGDGSSTSTVTTNKTFAISHAYDTQSDYRIQVTVDDGHGGIGAAVVYAVVLPADAGSTIGDYRWVTLQPGQDDDLTLFDPRTGSNGTLSFDHSATATDDVTVFFAIYTSSPVSTKRKGDFFDIQISKGTVSADSLTLTFTSQQIKADNFQFGFFPPGGGSWVDLYPNPPDPTLVSVTVDQQAGTMTVTFKKFNFITGTVFTVGLPPASTTTTTATVQPATAQANTGVTNTLSDSPSTAIGVAFTSSTQLSVAVTAAGESRSAANGNAQGTGAEGGRAAAAASAASGTGGGDDEQSKDDGSWWWPFGPDAAERKTRPTPAAPADKGRPSSGERPRPAETGTPHAPKVESSQPAVAPEPHVPANPEPAGVPALEAMVETGAAEAPAVNQAWAALAAAGAVSWNAAPPRGLKARPRPTFRRRR